MKRLKKYVCIVLSAMMFFSAMSMTVLGAEETIFNSSNDYIIETSKEERDANFNSEMNKLTLEQITPKGLKYKYKTDYLSYVYKDVSGYAGNQQPGGYSIETGGAIYYVESGGPALDVSVSVSLPKPFDAVSVSANLGQRTSGVTGLFANLPADNHYYKLYVTKTMEIRPYVVYRARTGTEDWEIDHSGAVPMTYRTRLSLKMVS